MPKNITSVNWTASSIPSGMNFDTSSGTFSGSPDEPGEYSVPVSVTTNYGSDTKDVEIKVVSPYNDIDPPLGEVYAIGSKADVWSEGAEPDQYGFRKLNMPNATKLVGLYEGFAARTDNGDFWTCCQNAAYLGLDASKTESNKPFLYPVDNIFEMASFRGLSIGFIYFYYRNSLNEAHTFSCNSGGTAAITQTVFPKAIRLSSDFGYTPLAGILMSNNSYTSGISVSQIRAVPFEAKNVKKIIYYMAGGNYYPAFLMNNGSLWMSKNGTLDFSEKISDVFGGYIKSFSVLTENNELYDISVKADQTKVGSIEKVFEGKVKKFLSVGYKRSFLLTEDGTLYFKGEASGGSERYGITRTYSDWTSVYPEYKFGSIAKCININTLIATIIKE